MDREVIVCRTCLIAQAVLFCHRPLGPAIIFSPHLWARLFSKSRKTGLKCICVYIHSAVNSQFVLASGMTSDSMRNFPPVLTQTSCTWRLRWTKIKSFRFDLVLLSCKQGLSLTTTKIPKRKSKLRSKFPLKRVGIFFFLTHRNGNRHDASWIKSNSTTDKEERYEDKDIMDHILVYGILAKLKG